MVNDMDEKTKLEKFQQEALTKNKIFHFINAKEYTGPSEVYKKHAEKLMACLLFHGLRKSWHLCNIIFEMMLR